jgi:hypothetical protein
MSSNAMPFTIGFQMRLNCTKRILVLGFLEPPRDNNLPISGSNAFDFYKIWILRRQRRHVTLLSRGEELVYEEFSEEFFAEFVDVEEEED